MSAVALLAPLTAFPSLSQPFLASLPASIALIVPDLRQSILICGSRLRPAWILLNFAVRFTCGDPVFVHCASSLFQPSLFQPCFQVLSVDFLNDTPSALRKLRKQSIVAEERTAVLSRMDSSVYQRGADPARAPLHTWWRTCRQGVLRFAPTWKRCDPCALLPFVSSAAYATLNSRRACSPAANRSHRR